MASGSLTLTSSAISMAGGVNKYSVVWVSAANGAVTGVGFSLPAGTIVAVEFVPGTGGSQPTDLYDVDLLDAGGESMFSDGGATPASIGADLSNSVSAHRVPFIYGKAGTTYVRTWLHGGTYTLSVTNAGDTKSGTINIYMVPGVIT